MYRRGCNGFFIFKELNIKKSSIKSVYLILVPSFEGNETCLYEHCFLKKTDNFRILLVYIQRSNNINKKTDYLFQFDIFFKVFLKKL